MYELLEQVERLREAPRLFEEALSRSLFIEAARIVTRALDDICGEALRDVPALVELRSELKQLKRRLFDLLVLALRRFLYAEPGDGVLAQLVQRTVAAHRQGVAHGTTPNIDSALLRQFEADIVAPGSGNSATGTSTAGVAAAGNDRSTASASTRRGESVDAAASLSDTNDNDDNAAVRHILSLLPLLPDIEAQREELTFVSIIATSLALLDGIHAVRVCVFFFFFKKFLNTFFV